jgi:hypothetical protein
VGLGFYFFVRFGGGGGGVTTELLDWRKLETRRKRLNKADNTAAVTIREKTSREKKAISNVASTVVLRLYT